MASTKAEPWHGQDHKGQCFFHIFIVNPALQTTHSHYFALVPQRLGTNVATTWHDCHARHARHAARIAAQVLARFGCLCFWPCLLGGQLSSTRIQFRFSPSFVRVRLESTQCSHRCLLHVCSARLCFLQTSTPFARISSAPVKQKSVESFWERRKNTLRAFRQYSIMCIADHHENRCQLHLHYWKLEVPKSWLLLTSMATKSYKFYSKSKLLKSMSTCCIGLHFHFPTFLHISIVRVLVGSAFCSWLGDARNLHNNACRSTQHNKSCQAVRLSDLITARSREHLMNAAVALGRKIVSSSPLPHSEPKGIGDSIVWCLNQQWTSFQKLH